MSRHKERITEAKLVDGKVMIGQANGGMREARGRTDWARVDRLTDDEVERSAVDDGEDEFFPQGQHPTRVSRPFEPAR